MPDGVVAHIDDVVLPVSWSALDERNQNCYSRVSFGSTALSANLVCYEGIQFAAALREQLTAAVSGFTPLPPFTTTNDYLKNILTIAMSDSRAQAT